jgi:hypothetical protein
MQQRAVCAQVGESKSFDPEVYRKQAQANQASKVEASHRAYTGAGNILHHGEASVANSCSQPLTEASEVVDPDTMLIQ